MADFKVKFSETSSVFTARFKSEKSFGVNMGSTVILEDPNVDIYGGSYEITPTNEDQVLQTKGLMTSDNIRIKAIPKEYGLVTYDQNKTITIV